MSKAVFIVFEGIDGSGTTTQSSRLAQYIRDLGHPLVYTREPGGTPLAERIRELVLDPHVEEMDFRTELLLYAASRAQHVSELIGPALKAGTPVICDRFTDSTLAYQGYGRCLDLALIDQVNAVATGGLEPDLTIYLDLSIEEARRRRALRARRPDRLEKAGDGLQAKVRQAYLDLAARRPDSSLVLDAGQDQDTLAEAIGKALHLRWGKFPYSH
ncbi:MAG: dTMP kinase [Candidatus Latescibacteria bacterium]|nr:dTMP kinase [Candidatus Latescibacterota bacterium]